jgi:hypothetical protein
MLCLACPLHLLFWFRSDWTNQNRKTRRDEKEREREREREKKVEDETTQLLPNSLHPLFFLPFVYLSLTAGLEHEDRKVDGGGRRPSLVDETRGIASRC